MTNRHELRSFFVSSCFAIFAVNKRFRTMAKNKLGKDYIEWVLKLNASQTQREINNLKEGNKELEKSNKSLRSEMSRLAAEGKAKNCNS